jgi:hypothetical protein
MGDPTWCPKDPTKTITGKTAKETPDIAITTTTFQSSSAKERTITPDIAINFTTFQSS